MVEATRHRGKAAKAGAEDLSRHVSVTPRRARGAALEDAQAADVQFDPMIVFVVGALMTIGVAMVYSASVSVDQPAISLKTWWHGPLRQAVFSALGFFTMVLCAQLDYRVFSNETLSGRRWTALVWAIAMLLLILVLIPGFGTTRLGATRWIRIPLGSFDASFQPGEFAKVAMVLWLSALLARSSLNIRSWRNGFLPVFAGSITLIVLTGIEDYGTGALMGLLFAALLFLGGGTVLQFLLVIGGGAAAGAVLFFLKPSRMLRLQTFFSEQPDPSGAGYQISQALMAIGSGGWWGRGLGAGVQKYGYLPQAHNDFILAIVCEELGVAGGIVVVSLFVLLLLRSWWIAWRVPDQFGKLLATGLALMICLQAAFNVAVVTNSVPTKGISLPFVSAGGSGVVFLGMAAGLLASVGGAALREAARVRTTRPFRHTISD